MVGTALCAFAHPTDLTSVMPGLVPGIHVFTVARHKKTWTAGTGPTRKPPHDHPPRHPAPRRHPLALRRWHKRPAHACARSRLRDIRPALRAVAARLSRTGVLLAQGDANARCRRLSRDRAGPARLWPHHRMERGL